VTATISFTESDLFAALRGWLLQVVPAGHEVIRAQVNRVPEPKTPDFIVMTQVLRTRLSTNIDETFDVILTGKIEGSILTVSDLISGEIKIGASIDGLGVLPGTYISGAGNSAGTFAVSPAQTLIVDPYSTDFSDDFRGAAVLMYAGVKTAIAPTQFDIQLDIHGPASAQTAAIVSTLFRDEYATQYFDDNGIDAHPLYTSEPRQMPFINAEAQYEERWTLDVSLQVNQVVQVPQQFADKLAADLISVDAVYPPL
jgi:hypothetical protein